MRCRTMWWIGCFSSVMCLGCGEAKAPIPPGDSNPAKATADQNGNLQAVPSSSDLSRPASTAADQAFAELLEATHGSNPDAWSAAEKSSVW